MDFEAFKHAHPSFVGEKEEDWHQHSNGGGWVENTAKVSADSFVGEDACVAGESDVIKGSTIDGHAFLRDAGIVNSKVSDNAEVGLGARVIDSTISGNARVFLQAYVKGSTIAGDAHVTGNATVVKSTIRDQAAVYESAIVENSIVKDNARIKGNVIVDGKTIGGKEVVGQLDKTAETKVAADLGKHFVGNSIVVAENAPAQAVGGVKRGPNTIG